MNATDKKNPVGAPIGSRNRALPPERRRIQVAFRISPHTRAWLKLLGMNQGVVIDLAVRAFALRVLPRAVAEAESARQTLDDIVAERKRMLRDGVSAQTLDEIEAGLRRNLADTEKNAPAGH